MKGYNLPTYLKIIAIIRVCLHDTSVVQHYTAIWINTPTASALNGWMLGWNMFNKSNRFDTSCIVWTNIFLFDRPVIQPVVSCKHLVHHYRMVQIVLKWTTGMKGVVYFFQQSDDAVKTYEAGRLFSMIWISALIVLVGHQEDHPTCSICGLRFFGAQSHLESLQKSRPLKKNSER